MPRPSKCKCVSRMPRFRRFQPVEREASSADRSRIILNVEEYEVLRLLDYEGLTQEECAAQMDVGRATVQALYAEARKKMARFLVEGSCLQIEGGSYRLAEMGRARAKGEQVMKIAVTYENGQIFGHFGHTEQFKIYNVADGKILSSQVVDTNGSGHGALGGFLADMGVDTLICGGIGVGAQNALTEAGIRFYGGASGDADKAVEALLAGTLAFDPNVHCDHHDHEGHEHGGDHHCGGHCH